jgi:calreticulin
MSRAMHLLRPFGFLLGFDTLFLLTLSNAEVFFEENFDSAEWEGRWVQSKWKGGNGPAADFEWSAGDWFADEAKQKGIRTSKNMHYHSISSMLQKPFSNKGKDLVLQFSVKHEMQEFSFCGGGYIKLLPGGFDQATFGGPTPYSIMFGPDLCGYDISRIHLILNYKGENLLRNDDIKMEYDDKNTFTHLYTLVVKPDNTYTVYFDLKEKSSGSLHTHWNFPNKTSDDPSDKKPSDWVEVKKINDPTQKKPEDWVEEARIRDPEASAPAEWDVEEDGVWEAPMIDNPKYKGAWHTTMIDNPEYKGEWIPKQTDNPAYVENVYAFDDLGAVGFELWTVNKGSIFDNILVCDSWEHAKKVGEEIKKLQDKEKDAKSAYDKANGKDSSAAPPAGASDDDDDDDDSETVDIDKKQDL